LEEKLKGINIYLIGMMGSGKSTIGKLLAKELGYRFIDTDDIISQATHQSISDIFATEGEAAFRDLESQVLSEICAYKKFVIATGGGIILKQMNWSYLRHGIIIWLNVPVEELYNRLKEDQTRPLLQHPDPLQQLQTLLQQRQPLYSQADLEIMVDSDDIPEQVATQILEKIPTILKPQYNSLN
jgi:Shikimate kinase